MFVHFVHRHACRVDCFHCAHRIALDAWDLHKARDWIARHAEIVFHTNLRGMFDLCVGAVQRSD